MKRLFLSLTMLTAMAMLPAYSLAAGGSKDDNVRRLEQVSEVARHNAAVVAEMYRRSRQSQAEVEANVEKYLAEARAKAPQHQTYVPVFDTEPVKTRSQMHEEEIMSREELLTAFEQRAGNGRSRYVPKLAPTTVEKNYIFLYFDVPSDNAVGPVAMRVQYYADDPLDTQAVEFTINGAKYSVAANGLKTKQRGIFTSEWFDVEMTGDNQALLEAMGFANYVKLKFIGKSCNHIKSLTDEQVAQLRKAYFLHKSYTER
ncbi:MAG: hypothetical protein ACI308_07010 [Muribaculaceae bacterium]